MVPWNNSNEESLGSTTTMLQREKKNICKG